MTVVSERTLTKPVGSPTAFRTLDNSLACCLPRSEFTIGLNRNSWIGWKPIPRLPSLDRQNYFPCGDFACRQRAASWWSPRASYSAASRSRASVQRDDAEDGMSSRC